MREFIKENWYIFLIALFLFGANGHWPYAYYQLLRWGVCAAAAFVAFTSYKTGCTTWTWIFALVAILFNPIAPIYLKRDTWQVLDMATAIIFLVFLFFKIRFGSLWLYFKNRGSQILGILLAAVAIVGLVAVLSVFFH